MKRGCGDCRARITAPQTCFQLRCPHCGVINEATTPAPQPVPPAITTAGPPPGQVAQMMQSHSAASLTANPPLQSATTNGAPSNVAHTNSSKPADVIDLCESDNDSEHMQDSSNGNAHLAQAQARGVHERGKTQGVETPAPPAHNVAASALGRANLARIVTLDEHSASANAARPANSGHLAKQNLLQSGAGGLRAGPVASAPRSNATSAKQRAYDAKARAAQAFAARLQGR